MKELQHLIDTYTIELGFLEFNYIDSKNKGLSDQYHYFFGQWCKQDQIIRDLKGQLSKQQETAKPAPTENLSFELAFCRDYDEGETFPYIEINDEEGAVHYRQCDETRYPCCQPDYWDDEEFNLLLILDGRPVRARSIHFDFT